MRDASDMELLREYARQSSEAAFAELVRRHVNLVYSAALRHVGIAAQAEEITQAVFVILASKAASLREDQILDAWLFETTRLTALSFLRGERRRQFREQEAYMQSVLQESTPNPVWQQLAPLLDEAMMRLGRHEREAVVLRFFKGQSLGEVAAALNINEPAAQKRVSRALDKLRRFCCKRGLDSTATAIAENISLHSVQLAPVALAKTVTAVALAKSATASASTLALVKGALKAMVWANAKFACGIGAAGLLAGSVATIAVSNMADNEEGYQINGDMVYSTPARDFSRNFTLTVNGQNWAIHLTDPKSQANGIKYQEVVHLDGTVYRYDYYGKQGPDGPANSGSAVIELGDFPIEDGTFANFVWVGLASGLYFSQLTNDEVASMLSGANARYERAKAQWQLIPAAPYLPKSIDYYHEPIQGIILRPGVVLHQFDNGWKSGEYRVSRETNLNNRTFPLGYTYEQFKPIVNDTSSSNAVEHQLLVTVNVHSIQFGSVPKVLPPKTEGTTAVSDRRLSNATGNNENKRGIPSRLPPGSLAPQSMYFSTANRLPEKPDTAAINKSKQQTMINPTTADRSRIRPEQSSSQKRIWYSAILIAFTVAVIAGLLKRKWKN